MFLIDLVERGDELEQEIIKRYKRVESRMARSGQKEFSVIERVNEQSKLYFLDSMW